VRPAVEADAAAICEIYNQGIDDRVATLETKRHTPEERRQWLKSRSPRHPVIVAEITQPDTISNRPPTDQAGQAVPATTQPDTISNRPPTDQAGQAVPATIVAWGSLNQFNPREAYRHVVDFSIYVERGYRGRGTGRVVLTRLVELAREHGYHKMVLSAFPFNAAGMALYERLGFRTVGVYREQGMLDGRWVDTIVMEKLL
jgi:L-amino acid N-acyltransferase YncA